MKKKFLLVGLLAISATYADVSVQNLQGVGAFNAIAKDKLDSNFTAIENSINLTGVATVSVTNGATLTIPTNATYVVTSYGSLDTYTNTVTLNLTVGKKVTLIVAAASTNKVAFTSVAGTRVLDVKDVATIIQGSSTNYVINFVDN